MEERNALSGVKEVMAVHRYNVKNSEGIDLRLTFVKDACSVFWVVVMHEME